MSSGKERHSSNELQNFTITVKKQDGTLVQRTIDGYKIFLKEHPEVRLFVHQAVGTSSREEDCTGWCVTDESTGFFLCRGASKSAAVGRARRILAEKMDRFIEAREIALEMKTAGRIEQHVETEN